MTEEQLRYIIRESLKQNNNKKKQNLFEGIDFDEFTGEVSYNPNHENNVDTSVGNNPTKSKRFGNNINVYSIFRRKNCTDPKVMHDGNPLLYALKGENSWHFRSNKDKAAIFGQINKIVDKFLANGIYDVTIVIPSGNQLNYTIADVVSKKCKNCHTIVDVLYKMNADAVREEITQPDSYFMRSFKGNRQKYLQAMHELADSFNQMKQQRNNNFTYHFIKNPNLRKLITNTFKANQERVGEYSELINGKDILIIDDSITMGMTITSACNVIKTTYLPKSITVLTLLSEKYSN